MLEESLVKTDNGTRLLLSEADTSAVIRTVGEAVRSAPNPEAGSAVLVTTQQLRRPLQLLLAPLTPRVTVIKASELEPDVSLQILGRIEISGY